MKLQPVIGKSKSKNPSTSKGVLKSLQKTYPDNPLPGIVLEYRKLKKLTGSLAVCLVPAYIQGTYIESLPEKAVPGFQEEEQRIHCVWHHMNTATGRLASRFVTKPR